jgi:hypothetical protein
MILTRKQLDYLIRLADEDYYAKDFDESANEILQVKEILQKELRGK